jgi:hypothetical protein
MFARTLKPTTAILAALVLSATVVAGVSSASQKQSARATAPSAPIPPATVTSKELSVPRRGPDRPGTVVGSSALGVRVFANAKHGFALANLNGGQYPAATTNAGATWRIDGPVLHADAAQGPRAVTQVGAARPSTYFAWAGPGGGNAIDVTTNAGKHWWQAFLPGVPVAVVHNGELSAYVEVPTTSSPNPKAAIWVYVSKDGGRHWHYTNRWIS